MMSDNTVIIVDDDASVRDALSLLLGLRGYRTLLFESALTFLEAYRSEWYGCLLLDLRMPKMDGLTLQEELLKKGSCLPVIVITGHGDVASARQAFRLNAIDFLEKPLDEERLIQAIEEAFRWQSDNRRYIESQVSLKKRLEVLTPREREVLDLIVAGHHNRHISGILDISVRTVEVHKARVMTKLGAGSVSELVQICMGQPRQIYGIGGNSPRSQFHKDVS